MKEKAKTILREGIDLYYKSVAYPLVTSGRARLDREVAHERGVLLLQLLHKNTLLTDLVSSLYKVDNPRIKVCALDHEFSSPLGVEAGIDKRGLIYRALGAMGFSYIKVGGLTRYKYEGNKRVDSNGQITPRLFALEEDESFINRMGYPGDSYKVWSKRLLNGVNNGKRYSDLKSEALVVPSLSASKPSYEKNSAIDDLLFVSRLTLPHFKITEKSLTSPNTLGNSDFDDPKVIGKYAKELSQLKRCIAPETKIIWKLKPDLPKVKLYQIIEVILKEGVCDGLVMGNTSVNKELKGKLISEHRLEEGGLSGRGIKELNAKLTEEIYDDFVRDNPDLYLASVGGIQSAYDLLDRIVVRGAHQGGIVSALVDRQSSKMSLSYEWNNQIACYLESERINNLKDIRGVKEFMPSRQRWDEFIKTI